MHIAVIVPIPHFSAVVAKNIWSKWH